MSAATPLRVVLIAPGGGAANAAADAMAAGVARAGAQVALPRPATENALRQQLAAGPIDLLVFIGRGRSHASAAHATLDFDASSGNAARAVNLRHLAGLLGAAASTRLVLLLPVAADAPLRGMATALVSAGVAAAIGWPLQSLSALPGEALRRLLECWQRGGDLQALAQCAGPALQVEAAGALAVPVAPQAADIAPPAVRAAPLAQPGAQTMAEATAAPQAARAAAALQRLRAKREANQFDVFLCHNSADKPAVRAIAQALRERGILPWLDEAELPPGKPWQPLLEQQIERIGSAAVCVGQAGVGPWQQQELYGFLREFVDRQAPVIPLLLPDAPLAPVLPVFLRAMTYVDLRQHEPDPMDRLEWGITGVRPAPD